MSDFEAMLERELRVQLCPVAAPASLWERVRRHWAEPDRRRGSIGLILLPVAAIMLLTLSLSPVLRIGSAKSAISGSRVIRVFGTPVAVVAYRVGGHTAALLVSRCRAASAVPHPTSHGRIFAWDSPNQLYALALTGTGDSRGACILCHASGAAVSR